MLVDNTRSGGWPSAHQSEDIPVKCWRYSEVGVFIIGKNAPRHENSGHWYAGKSRSQDALHSLKMSASRQNVIHNCDAGRCRVHEGFVNGIVADELCYRGAVVRGFMRCSDALVLDYEFPDINGKGGRYLPADLKHSIVVFGMGAVLRWRNWH